VIPTPEEGRTLWRVGYYADPLGFTPLELYQFSHRFDDIYRRFRTLYCADLAETCLREVLADFRPNLGALRRHIERYGPEAAQDFPEEPVTAQWRRQHVLVPTVLRLDGPLIDLTDVPTRQEIEDRHVELLIEHEGSTSIYTRSPRTAAPSRRQSPLTYSTEAPAPSGFPLAWTATLASPSSSTASIAGDPIALTDPPPKPLTTVTTPWGLVLEPAPATVGDR
jgi:RES domain